MRERLQALGGTLTIASTPGKGTTIEARVPRPQSGSVREDLDADVPA